MEEIMSWKSWETEKPKKAGYYYIRSTRGFCPSFKIQVIRIFDMGEIGLYIATFCNPIVSGAMNFSPHGSHVDTECLREYDWKEVPPAE